jgi:hypothetical protein
MKKAFILALAIIAVTALLAVLKPQTLVSISNNVTNSIPTDTQIDILIPPEIVPVIVAENEADTPDLIAAQSFKIVSDSNQYKIVFPSDIVRRDACSHENLSNPFEYCFSVWPDKVNQFIISNSQGTSSFRLAKNHSFMISKGNTGGPYAADMHIPKVHIINPATMYFYVYKWNSYEDTQATEEFVISFSADTGSLGLVEHSTINTDYSLAPNLR